MAELKFGSNIRLCEEIFPTFENYTLNSCQFTLCNINSNQTDPICLYNLKQSRKIINNKQIYTCIHSNLSYPIYGSNICGSTKSLDDSKLITKLTYIINNYIKEIDIATMMGSGLVIHSGTCKNKSEGFKLASSTLEKILLLESEYTSIYAKSLGLSIEDFIKQRKILIENMAGQGNQIGTSLSELKTIYDNIDTKVQNQIKFCIDTQHIFGAGEYNFGNTYDIDKFYNDFNISLGLDKLEVFHFNDSKVTFGSRVDRHEDISKGHIFKDKDNLKYFVLSAHQRGIPLVLETPGEFMNNYQTVCSLFQ